MSEKFLKVNTDGLYEEALGYLTNDFINTSAGAGDAGKPIVLNASGLIDSTMVDASSVDHGGLSGLGDDDHTQYSLADGTRNYTGIISYSTAFSFTTDNQLVSKKYVDDVHTGDEWFPYSALSYVTDNTAAPATEVTGDVYVLSHDGGTPHANYDGASAGDIVRFDGSDWIATTPTTGTKISIDDETDGVRLWTGASWDRKYYESTTASTGLVKVGSDIRIDASAAGDGIGFTAGVLNVNVDDSSIETSADTLQVKALGITDAMLAGSISDGKLAEDYIQTDEVDDATIEWTGTTLQVKADGINDTHIDFGTGTNQVNDADLPVTDTNNYFTGSTQSAVNDELYLAATFRGVDYTVGTGGVSAGDVVYISANDTVLTYGTLTSPQRTIGLAFTTEAAASEVKIAGNDTVVSGVLSGATAGTAYYWDGSSLVTTPPNGTGQYVVQAGVAKNATDLHVECRIIKKNL